MTPQQGGYIELDLAYPCSNRTMQIYHKNKDYGFVFLSLQFDGREIVLSTEFSGIIAIPMSEIIIFT